MKFVAGTILILSLAFLLSVTGSSCANIVPPSGGPRDSLPPKLLKASPPNGTTNFRSKTIELVFDEYVDLSDVSKNFLFTPTFNINPNVEVKSRTITVKLKDTLDPNTTYIFNFGDAIRDINEGNVLHNFTYKFSTGPAIDSLTFSGNVILAETGTIDSTLSVFLYKNLNDSAVVNEKPRYITKLDHNGNFTFENLAAGTYKVYAIGDPTGSRRYLAKTQLFAFADWPVVVKAGVKPDTLYAYKEIATNVVATTTQRISPAGDRRLKFNTNLSSGQQDLLKNLELDFERPLKVFDSGKIRLAIDSNYTKVAFSSKLDSARKKLVIRSAWKEGAAYHLILDKNFAEDTLGRKLLREDTIHFAAKKLSDYGNLLITIRNVNLKKNPVLQFVQNNQVVFSAPVPQGRFSSNLFYPGDYELRVLYDTNGNGVWDAGEFFKLKRQPELVKKVDRRVTVKPNWDNEFEIAL
jgi:uncharacterized protein (DUF2141 family)